MQCQDESELEDKIKEAAQLSQERALLPLVEDVSEWLNKTLGTSIQPENFMESLDTGVVLCQLILKIQEKQKNASKEKIKFNNKAPPGGWHARDNAATFIMWCKHFHVKPEVLFESDGLVSHKQKREVVLCLLELARVAARYKIEPPALLKLEKEIEQEEKLMARLPSPGPNGNLKNFASNSNTSTLDSEVLAMTNQCSCQPSFFVQKLKDGIYTLGPKRCLVRQFKGRHIMVRVGGGWDTLENYLSCHDPCRVYEFRKKANQEDLLTVQSAEGVVLAKGYNSSSEDNRFVHVKGRYKSTVSNKPTS